MDHEAAAGPATGPRSAAGGLGGASGHAPVPAPSTLCAGKYGPAVVLTRGKRPCGQQAQPPAVHTTGRRLTPAAGPPQCIEAEHEQHRVCFFNDVFFWHGTMYYVANGRLVWGNNCTAVQQ